MAHSPCVRAGLAVPPPESPFQGGPFQARSEGEGGLPKGGIQVGGAAASVGSQGNAAAAAATGAAGRDGGGDDGGGGGVAVAHGGGGGDGHVRAPDSFCSFSLLFVTRCLKEKNTHSWIKSLHILLHANIWRT